MGLLSLQLCNFQNTREEKSIMKFIWKVAVAVNDPAALTRQIIKYFSAKKRKKEKLFKF